MYLKQDSPSTVVKAIEAIEKRADSSCEGLELYTYPRGVASWAILVCLVLESERLRQAHGHRNYDVNLINLSIRGAVLLRWVQEKCSDANLATHGFALSSSLANAVKRALQIAADFQNFVNCFSMWHQNRELAEVLSESRVRFTVPGGEPARRVSAFQKGFRPNLERPQNEGLTLDQEQERIRDVALSCCFCSGHLAMAYPEPIALYRSLLPSYLDRVSALFRHADSASLGPYIVGELKQAHASLCAVFATHEDLCYRYGLRYGYPANSCVMTRSREAWTELLARISGLDTFKCSAIIDDLTVTDRFWDLHVQPFIPVGGDELAAAPQFPLYSRADENILRVCNHRRRLYFRRIAGMKESEMLDELLPAIPKHFEARERISLPGGRPDIDLVLRDEESGAVMVAELKWLQKPSSHWKAYVDRTKDFWKGVQQLSKIRTFLEGNPHFLTNSGMLERPLNKYDCVAFLYIVRDFFLWPDSKDIILTDYDAFKAALDRTHSLGALIERLKSYDWLPVEGKNFRVLYEPQELNGITVESETFYRI